MRGRELTPAQTGATEAWETAALVKEPCVKCGESKYRTEFSQKPFGFGRKNVCQSCEQAKEAYECVCGATFDARQQYAAHCRRCKERKRLNGIE